MPNGKQRREICDRKNPYSIELAKAAHGKRLAQRVEIPSILERMPDETMTYKALTDWYLKLKSIKKLATHKRVEQCFNAFNEVLGDRLVSTVTPVDLENYQGKRDEQGRAAATVYMEITYVKAMISKAFDNDMVSGRTLKAFRSIKRTLRRGDNAREALVSFKQYLSLINSASPHYRAVLVIAHNTGMRLGEIRLLRWPYIDKKDMMIRLPKEVVKERRDKRIPINHHVLNALNTLPKAVRS
jgi:integrase